MPRPINAAPPEASSHAADQGKAHLPAPMELPPISEGAPSLGAPVFPPLIMPSEALAGIDIAETLVPDLTDIFDF